MDLENMNIECDLGFTTAVDLIELNKEDLTHFSSIAITSNCQKYEPYCTIKCIYIVYCSHYFGVLNEPLYIGKLSR